MSDHRPGRRRSVGIVVTNRPGWPTAARLRRAGTGKCTRTRLSYPAASSSVNQICPPEGQTGKGTGGRTGGPRDRLLPSRILRASSSLVQTRIRRNFATPSSTTFSRSDRSTTEQPLRSAEWAPESRGLSPWPDAPLHLTSINMILISRESADSMSFPAFAHR
jgi:hypothetical protein